MSEDRAGSMRKRFPGVPLIDGIDKVTGSSITMKVTGHDKDGAKIETIVNNKSIASEHGHKILKNFLDLEGVR